MCGACARSGKSRVGLSHSSPDKVGEGGGIEIRNF